MANAAIDEHAVLRAGQRYVAGVVEYAENERAAVEVHVNQRGHEHRNKHGWSHTWTEIDRKTFAQPFYVRRADRERIRVEPGSSVLLVDQPDGMIWRERGWRTRIARLSAGEHVIVEGSLTRAHDPEQRDTRAYRDAGQGWVMRPLRDGHIHISAETLDERHKQRAKLFKSAARTTAVLGLLMQAVLCTYHARLFWGKTEIVTLINKDHYVTRGSKGSLVNHYRVFFKLPPLENEVLSEEISEGAWRGLAQGFPMYYRLVPEWRGASALGRDTSLLSVPLIATVLIGLFSIGAYAEAAGHKMWYEGKLNDKGSGRLPDPPA